MCILKKVPLILELLPISLIKLITDFGDLFKNKIPKNWTEDEKITVKVDDSYILKVFEDIATKGAEK